MTSVLASWSRIHAWLAPNVPQVFAALRAGATEEQISALEARIGARLPNDARQSFAIHDGSGDFGLVNTNDLLSLEGAAGEWSLWKSVLDNGDFNGFQAEPGPGVRDGWFRTAWLPLTYDGAGNHACLDLDPAPGGKVGQVIEFWHDANDREVVATSFGAWLSKFADDLEAGAYKVDAKHGWLEWAG